MTRYFTPIIFIFLSLGLLACGQNQPAQPTATATFTPVTVIEVSTTATATPWPSPTPTSTPTPTNTPLPAARMEQATLAWHNGYYATAEAEFGSVVDDPAAGADDKRLALYWQGRSQLADGASSQAQTTLEKFTQTYPADELARPARLNLALALEGQGNYTPTLAAYQAALLPDDPIAVYIYERMADLALKFADFSAAQKWYQSAITATADTGYQVHLREGLAEAFLGQKKTDEALAQYNLILNSAQIPAYRAKIYRLIGEAQLQAKNTAAAQKTFQSVLDDYPQTYDAYLTLVTMVEAQLPVDEFQRGYIDYYGGSAYQAAAEALTRYLKTSPAKKADEAHWLAALAWRSAGDYDAALIHFDALIADYPDSTFWADATLQKARTLGWQGQITQSVTLYRDFAAANPDNPAGQEALWKAALVEYQADQFADAYRHFTDLAQAYPAGSYADDAMHWAGLSAYLNGNYAGAAEAWQSLLSNYPASEFARAASYWQAKTLLAQKETEPAHALLAQLSGQPFNFYGLRAADLLADSSAEITFDWSEPSPAEQAEAETWLAGWLGLSQNADLAALDWQIAGDPAFVRAETLLAGGLRAEALDEYEQVRKNWADNPLAMYQLSLAFRDRGAYRLSVLAAQELVAHSPATDPATVPKFIRRLIYPIYYQDLVLAQAEVYQVDPALLFSLIRQESLFDPQANSYADARGLMQIMPATGDDIANRANITGYSLEKLWLPYYNIEFGSWYIRQMLDFVGENPFAALAAYNAGPGRADEWLQYTGAQKDPDIFIALIPLSEPQDYVRRIYLNLAAYREIYGQK